MVLKDVGHHVKELLELHPLRLILIVLGGGGGVSLIDEGRGNSRSKALLGLG